MNKSEWLKGIVHTFIGLNQPGYNGDGGIAQEALVNGPAGLAIDSNNDVYIAEIFNNVVRKIDTRTNIVTTIAGCGDKGFSGDFENACNASLNCPSGVVGDSIGNVYFNDYKNERIRKVDINGVISTFAGTGESGYTGDGGPANQAKINDVYGLAIDKYDNLYFVDSLNFAIRKINIHSEIINTVCGKGKPGAIVEFESIDRCYLGGNAHPKGTVGGDVPHGLDVSKEGYIFIADTGVNRLRIVDPFENQVYTIAGIGEGGGSGDGGLALEAKINIQGVRVDLESNIYFVDFYHHVVRKITFK